MDDRELTGVVLEFSDGTVERPEKCACWTFGSETDDGMELTAVMLNMSGNDLKNLIWAAIAFGDKIGLFNDVQKAIGEKLDDELVRGSSSKDPAGMPSGEVI